MSFNATESDVPLTTQEMLVGSFLQMGSDLFSQRGNQIHLSRVQAPVERQLIISFAR